MAAPPQEQVRKRLVWKAVSAPHDRRPQTSKSRTPARFLQGLLGVLALTMLPGITTCNTMCTYIDAQGNPVQLPCVECSTPPVPCMGNVWYLPPGSTCLEEQRPVLPDGTACDAGAGSCQTGVCQPDFPCTEQGILDAIAVGGGPHRFACIGPTTVTTLAEIVIDNDVILDGEGNLTLESVFPYPQVLLAVVPGVTSELVGLRLVHYPGDLLPIQTIRNEGSLSLTDCIIEPGDYSDSHGTAIYSDGSLTLSGTALLGSHSAFGHCPGIQSFGSLTLVDSTVSDIGAPDGHAVCSSGSLLMIGSAVIDSVTVGGAILCDGDSTLVNSTVSGNTYAANTNAVAAGGTLTLINSTIAFSGRGLWTLSSEEGGPEPTDLFATNSIIVGPGSAGSPPYAACWGLNTFSGGGNIESPGDSCGLTDPTDLVNVSAAELNLGPLADNGGPTKTHALLPGSVAIDHIPASMCVDADGQPLTTDQRGVARPQGAMCDVGAFEVEAGLCGGFTTGACEDPSLSCQCCPIGGPAQSCLCSTPCNSDAECTDPSRTTCNRPDFVGSTGFCAPAEFTCCWLCV